MGIAAYDTKKVNAVMEAVENTPRKKYYEDMGITLENVHSLESALKLSGLDYSVEKRPVQFVNKVEQEWNGQKILVDTPFIIPDQFATIRTDTNAPLGIVGKNYNILQNREAFDFLDSLAMGGAKFETAGSFGPNGAKSFITMSTEPMKILDDEFLPTMLFLNAHDGSKAIQAMFVSIRIFCSNCLARARKEAQNRVSIRHSNSMQAKLEQAKTILLQNTNYLEALKTEAEKLAVQPYSKEAFEALAKRLFPINTEDTEIMQIRNLAMIEKLMKAYNEDDLQNFNGTAWKALQAISDFESHPVQLRKSTKSTTTPAFTSVAVNTMPLLNMVWNEIAA